MSNYQEYEAMNAEIQESENKSNEGHFALVTGLVAVATLIGFYRVLALIVLGY